MIIRKNICRIRFWCMTWLSMTQDKNKYKWNTDDTDQTDFHRFVFSFAKTLTLTFIPDLDLINNDNTVLSV